MEKVCKICLVSRDMHKNHRISARAMSEKQFNFNSHRILEQTGRVITSL